MRTTVEFDPDVAAELKRIRKAQALGLKELVNDLLRAAIKERNAPKKKREPYRTQPLDLGRPVLPNLDNIHDVLVFAEGEDYK